jgi:hypothetical protein
MIVIPESVFVGCYILVIYLLLQHFIPFTLILLFLVGFLKHFLGYWIGLHQYICGIKKATQNYLISDSIIEGIVVTLVTLALSFFVDIRLAVFLTGVLLHLFAEILGFHAYFIKYRCN